MSKPMSVAFGLALCLGVGACGPNPNTQPMAVVNAPPAPSATVRVNNAVYAGRASLIRGTERDCIPQESPFTIRVRDGAANLSLGASNFSPVPIARDGSVQGTEAGYRVNGRFASDGFSGIATRASCTYALGATPR